jgi:two-component system, cell cycle sensor histidine kinase and response regulator CckA
MPSAEGQPSHVVLVVDDDRMMRALLVRILRAEGWHIYSAAAAVEALAFLAAGPGVDIVVSDVMMPRMDGRELAAELGRRFPRMPVLLISGAHLGGRSYAGPFLPKPFSPMSLVATIRELMAAGEKVS